MAKRNLEPLWWALFSAGGVCFGVILPAVILWFGVLLPLGIWPEAFTHAAMREYLDIRWRWLVLLVVLVLPAFHVAHRLRHGFMDLKLGQGAWTRWCSYGPATILALVALAFVLTACGFDRDDFRPYEGVIINSVVGDGGDLDPRSKEIRRGRQASFQVLPASGYEVDDISGCNGELQPDLTYQTGRVQADCTIRVAFAQADQGGPNPFEVITAPEYPAP